MEHTKEPLSETPEVDPTEIEKLINDGQHVVAWNIFPSVLRRELLSVRPFGEPWTKHVQRAIDTLTKLGSLSIITDNVTKDSDGRKP